MNIFKRVAQSNVLSTILISFLFVVTFVFCNWQLANSFFVGMLSVTNSWIIITSTIIFAIVVAVVIPFITQLLLDRFHIYCVPRREYCLLVLLLLCSGNTLCGALNLLTLALPQWGNWITIFSRLLGNILSWLLIYNITSRLYFNDGNRKHYFMAVAIVFFVTSLVGVFL